MLDPLKLAGVPVRVPLRDERIDLDAMLAAITPRTKLVFIAAPNNPTGTTNSRAELDAYFERVPARVLTVVDQAYLEYVADPDYPDAVSEYFQRGHRVLGPGAEVGIADQGGQVHRRRAGAAVAAGAEPDAHACALGDAVVVHDRDYPSATAGRAPGRSAGGSGGR